MKPGDLVRHASFGQGRIVHFVGKFVLVDFFGELIEVEAHDLELDRPDPIAIVSGQEVLQRKDLRRAYEAINLGVVPPNPEQLLAISMNGRQTTDACEGWLSDAPQTGLCKAIFGDYGSGKSHFLRLCEAIALRSGWVVSFIEFDPKQADPAKPHLVYRALMGSLKFPARENGVQVSSFYDFVKEIRDNWDRLGSCSLFQESPWFKPALSSLRFFPHNSDPRYINAIEWLSGNSASYPGMKSLFRSAGSRAAVPPTMPKTRETAEIYAFHLAVVNELCKALGYKGLLLILDEAEHVRGFTVQRRERANNFFDFISRASRPRQKLRPLPIPNDFNYNLPKYWQQGPHFGLLIGLTEGDTFEDSSQELHDACVFLSVDSDLVRLRAPEPAAFESWASTFLAQFVKYFPAEMELISSDSALKKIAGLLTEGFAQQGYHDRTLRLWTKLTSFVPSLLFAGAVHNMKDLEGAVRTATAEASGEILPWDS